MGTTVADRPGPSQGAGHTLDGSLPARRDFAVTRLPPLASVVCVTASTADLRVITFNTAVGNPKIKTAQRDFLALPFYREIIAGEPGAAILALQEVGPDQARALDEAASGAGARFTLVRIQRPGQGNALLIPGRFRVLSRRSRYFVTSQLRALAGASWRALRRRAPLNHRQYLELRMWSMARLADEATGRELTVCNTHLSGEAPLRLAQARSLLKRVHRARERGPLILAGDLNVRATSAKPASEAAIANAAVRDLFAPLENMAAGAVDPRRPAIDWILAAGFAPVSARLYTDHALSLPNSPTAELISDHYAKEAVLRPL